jgi:hypothetical protein
LASGFGQLAVMAIENIKNKGVDRPLIGPNYRIDSFNYANNKSGHDVYSNNSNKADDKDTAPQFRVLIANDDNF